MTGYGSASAENPEFSVNCEVKTLNSKYLDIQFRLPRTLSDKELEIRTIISDLLTRGKVNLMVEVGIKSPESLPSNFNKVIFKKYYDELKELANYVGDPGNECFRIALQQPDVNLNQFEKTSDDLWALVKSTLIESLEKCNQFRVTEGNELERVLIQYINEIATGRERVKELEIKRAPRIRERIMNNFNSLNKDDLAVEPNRLEQEIIFYLEKLDITEELDRLNSHLKHFLDILKLPEYSGKKIGFLAQELGREINTIGSKANDAEIQKVVVQMKENLEKIKEQSLNLL